MITKINISKVSSYISPTTLETDKTINLIYGLNGTGKSTLSDYLLKRTDEKYNNCSIEGLDEECDILVYNQTFIRETFFESENLKGIFTLSKENKEAETKISNASKEIEKLEKELGKQSKKLESEKTLISQKLERAKKTIWKIKTDYSGGDRVLEFCLDGYKGSKDSLFNHILSIPKPKDKPEKSIDDLKNEIQSISGDNAQKFLHIPIIDFSSSSIENEGIFSKKIVGNKNSSVSDLITKLGNSDWVKSGFKYLPKEIIEENENCPFCQEKTISNKLVEEIKNYFDDSYESDINTLKGFLQEYQQSIQQIPDKNIYESNPKFESFQKDFDIKFSAFNQLLNNNLKKIEAKIKSPSSAKILKSSTTQLDELNKVIKDINSSILEHNNNINQKTTVRNSIKSIFWNLMRWEYDQTIDSCLSDKKSSDKKLQSLKSLITDYKTKISEHQSIIVKQQKQTVNIEEAISNINGGLAELGITDFKIENHYENLYKIVRGENNERVFSSLSEGEKMIISFLYFIEMCRGKKEATETAKKK